MTRSGVIRRAIHRANARALVFRAGLALALALAIAGCGLGAAYRVIDIPLQQEAPLALGPKADEAEIARVVGRLFREKLDLPLPAETRVYLYVNEATLADGLVRDAGLTSQDAWERARFAAGVASPRGVFLRADRYASMSLTERVALIAHELTHVSQIEMRRGGRGFAATWVREGHADWAKYQVLDALGLRSYDLARDEVRRSIRRSPAIVKHFPTLENLARHDQWTDARNRLGSAATYGQAFLAVDRLVERFGIERLHEFLRRFALGSDVTRHWSSVYPIPARQFMAEFRTWLEALE